MSDPPAFANLIERDVSESPALEGGKGRLGVFADVRLRCQENSHARLFEPADR
jgi:hypothetical protein